MTRIRTFALLLLAFVAAPLFAAARGTADFTRFVVIGDSYAAGVESSSLNVNHQQFSWPSVIARQAGAPDFQQPLVSFPGISQELQLVDAVHFPPTILPAPGSLGQPINLNLPRPYNNLAVPGANVSDVITLTGKEAPSSTAKIFASFILRGLGTEVQQAIALNPTFIAIWIGGNDALGAVESGNVAALTPLDTFTTAYNSMLDQLTKGAPNAGMVVGNIPDNVEALPYLTAVPTVIINPATGAPVLIGGQPVPLFADLGGGNIGPLPPGSFVLLPAAAKLASGYGIPPQLAQISPFNQLPNAGKPLVAGDFLTAADAATIKQRVDAYNTVIQQAASSRNIPVADIKGLFDRLATLDAKGNLVGLFAGPVQLTSAYITGGAFSLDGIHMTDIGYTLFADQYIKTINDAYGTHIPLAPLTNFLQNNILTMTSGLFYVPGTPYEVSSDAAKEMSQFAPVLPQRRHAIH
jgi:lysophospholipase L1-like esterase